MARIPLTGNTLVQNGLITLSANIIAVQQQAARLKAIADQITNNGAQKVNLETSSESAVPAGTGVALYDGLASINTALASLSAVVSAIDRGVIRPQ